MQRWLNGHWKQKRSYPGIEGLIVKSECKLPRVIADEPLGC